MPNPGTDNMEKYSTDAWRVWGVGGGGGDRVIWHSWD